MIIEYRYGYRNKGYPNKWLYFDPHSTQAECVDFHPDILWLAKNVLQDEFSIRCESGSVKKAIWELVKFKITYEEVNE